MKSINKISAEEREMADFTVSGIDLSQYRSINLVSVLYDVIK